MKQIRKAHENTLTILGAAKRPAAGCRLMKYCLEARTDDGILLLNLLTREMVLLSEEEYANLTQLPELRQRWFVVPEELDEKEFADMVRWVRQSLARKKRTITQYTILSTMDCNARCFYCYEKGRPRTPMSAETADKTVDYIKAHCNEEKVNIMWFGGEPLYNLPVIDRICEGLNREGVEYACRMVSNGYLFDDETVEKAVSLWKLKHVQITLDGTEAVYNRSKAFIYRQGSAYQVVLANIGRLLKAGIQVAIRLNLDLYNAENLMQLADELAERFSGMGDLRVYTHLLFDDEHTEAKPRSDAQWTARYTALQNLNDKLRALGLASPRRLPGENRVNYCMADSGSAVVVFPGGDLGLCEHLSEDGYVGHVDSQAWDKKIVAGWREPAEELPECRDCFYYPSCLRLKQCPTIAPCIPQFREQCLRETQRSMLQEYTLWRSGAQQEETEEQPDC